MISVLAALGGATTVTLAIALVVYVVKLGNARVTAASRLARIDALERDRRELESVLATDKALREEDAARWAALARGKELEIARLQKQLEDYASRDPVVAGDLLAAELQNVPGADDAPARIPTVPATPSAKRDAGGSGEGQG